MRFPGFVLAMALVPAVAAFSLPVAGPSAARPDATLRAVLDTAMQDEHFARSVYERVLRDHGAVMPFSNVVLAEQRHADHIAALLTARGDAVPPSRWNADLVPAYASVHDACVAASGAEDANIAMYDRLLKRDLPADVRAVFEQNRWASEARHKPAFERCVARGR